MDPIITLIAEQTGPGAVLIFALVILRELYKEFTRSSTSSSDQHRADKLMLIEAVTTGAEQMAALRAEIAAIRSAVESLRAESAERRDRQ